jgi:hypothetical protein
LTKHDLLSLALELADQYPVFPCNAKKQPTCEGGFKAATQDPDEITKLFNAAPSATLIGVPTGSASGISVVDVDVRDGKQGKEWVYANQKSLGLTRIVRTQSGGWHYYYKHQEGITNRAGIAKCIDIRGEGGYVIMPPSEGYTFLNDEDLLDFPDFLIGANIDSTAPNNTAKTTDAFGSITDGREKYMSDLIYANVMNFRRDNGRNPTEEWMVTNVWTQYALKVKSRTGDLENEDRGITMFMKKVRSTLRKLGGQPIEERGEFDDPEPEVPMPEYVDENEIATRQRVTWYDPLELKQMPPPSFLIPPYVLTSSFAVLFGAPASYKSFLALDWALCIAHGVDWNGRAVEQGRVIYMAMEGQAGLVQRMDAWHNDNGLLLKDAKITCAVTPLSLADEMTETSDMHEIITSLDDRLGDEKPKLIIVDTLARSFTGKDENSATDMGIFVRNMDILKQHYGCATLAVHHSGKDSDRGMRGSSALRGAVDSEFEIKRNGDTMNVCLSVKKQKDTEEADPLWMEAREVSWLESNFGVERTSLVLDPSDEPKKKESVSQDQKLALDVLDSMLENENVIEKDFRGNYGVPQDYWRDSVVNSIPKLEDAKKWYNFVTRLEKRNYINIINKLVQRGSVN